MIAGQAASTENTLAGAAPSLIDRHDAKCSIILRGPKVPICAISTLC